MNDFCVEVNKLMSSLDNKMSACAPEKKLQIDYTSIASIKQSVAKYKLNEWTDYFFNNISSSNTIYLHALLYFYHKDMLPTIIEQISKLSDIRLSHVFTSCLLDYGMTINYTMDDVWTAAKASNIDAFYCVYNQAKDIDMKLDCRRIFEYAIASEDMAILRFLVRTGLDLDEEVFSKAGTPLYIACERGSLPVLRFLIDAGADVNKINRDGFTPIYIAAYRGHVDCLNCLLDVGVELDLSDSFGFTPLMIAAISGDKACLQGLIAGGANLEQTTSLGFNALQFALQYHHKECLVMILTAMLKQA